MVAGNSGVPRTAAEARAAIRRVGNARLRSREEILEAIRTLDAAVALLPVDSAGRRSLIVAAQGWQLKGDLCVSVTRADDAMDAYESAEAHFERAGGDSEEYGRFLHDFSVILQRIGQDELALQYARHSRKVLAPYGIRQKRKLDGWISRLESGLEAPGASTPPRRSKGRGVVPAARGRQKAEDAQAQALQLIFGSDPGAHVGEISELLRSAYQVVSKRGPLEDECIVLCVAFNLYVRGVDLPDWLAEAASAADSKAREAGRADLASNVLTLLAACLHQSGQLDEALDVALRAIALHDEHMLATESSILRMLTGGVGEMGRTVALNLAVALDDAPLAAELVEGARLQVEPGQADPPGTDPGKRRSRVHGLRPVSVGGTSRLAKYYAPGTLGHPLALESAIGSIGGPGAAWWGMWSISQSVYWALYADGRWSCGALSLAERTELRSLLLSAFDGSMHNRKATLKDRLAGAWCRNVAAEELLSVDLGEALIPPALKKHLLGSAGSQPLSLVVAGNFAALVPLPLLGLSTGLLSRPIRLVEAAVLRIAPPAIIAERAAWNGSAHSRAAHPVLVACVNPTGDLRHSGEIPPGTRTALSGDPLKGLPPASPGDLARALASSAPGAPGIFYYAGHSAKSNFSDDEDSLALTGGLLAAHMLFSPAGDRYSFPARSMVSACDSSGVSGGGAGEWLGLTAALLWRGSRQVVATNWKIWDLPFTSSFELALVERLQSAPDSALALRDAQLDALESWRASTHDYSDYGKDDTVKADARLAFPLVWAAYCSVGVHN